MCNQAIKYIKYTSFISMLVKLIFYLHTVYYLVFFKKYADQNIYNKNINLTSWVDVIVFVEYFRF